MATTRKRQKSKSSHGGVRPGAGRRKRVNGRVLLTVRIESKLRKEVLAKIGRTRGALTRYIEELIKKDVNYTPEG
jgi:hypothetical protein